MRYDYMIKTILGDSEGIVANLSDQTLCVDRMHAINDAFATQI
jgi:hypothetical protein